jgi:hypothetical protein
MVELGSRAATERAVAVTLRLTVWRVRILSRQPYARIPRIREGKSRMAALPDQFPTIRRFT